MEWSEEKYVKLYIRDTVTWLSWPWQARALWPVLMRKLDGAGLLECGNTNPAKAISIMVLLPLEVVEAGLVALLESGTLERVQNGVLAPKFLLGQEARKSDALRARESRDRRRTEARASKPSELGSSASHGVTPSHTASQTVTLQPSPAQPSPSPAQPEEETRSHPLADLWNAEKPTECVAVRAISAKRKKAADARLRETPDLERWRMAIRRAHKSRFLRGSKGWRADFEWLVRPDTLEGLEGGKYDDGPSQTNGPARVEDQGWDTEGPLRAKVVNMEDF